MGLLIRRVWMALGNSLRLPQHFRPGLQRVLKKCEEAANAGFAEYAVFRSGSCVLCVCS